MSDTKQTTQSALRLLLEALVGFALAIGIFLAIVTGYLKTWLIAIGAMRV